MFPETKGKEFPHYPGQHSMTGGDPTHAVEK